MEKDAKGKYLENLEEKWIFEVSTHKPVSSMLGHGNVVS